METEIGIVRELPLEAFERRAIQAREGTVVPRDADANHVHV